MNASAASGISNIEAIGLDIPAHLPFDRAKCTRQYSAWHVPVGSPPSATPWKHYEISS